MFVLTMTPWPQLAVRALIILTLSCFALLGLPGCKKQSQAGASDARPAILRIGWVPNEEDVERRARWEGLRAYLERRLGMPVELLQTGQYSAAIEAMRAEKLDVCGLAPFAYLIASEKGAAEPLVAPGFSDGQPNRYRSGFIVPKESPLRTMEDVKARARELTLAWADPASASGHLVPRAFLESIGMNPEKDFKQVIFSMNHTGSIMTVKAGKVDIAAITTTSLRNMIEKKRIADDDVRVIWESEPIMASIIAMRRDLSPAFKDELRAAYLAFATEDPSAWSALSPIYLSPGVVWVAAQDSDFESLRKLARGVKQLHLLN
jgi:phosphonate transport system substrate-binding protein